MARNPERDRRERLIRQQKILEGAYPIFAEKGIDNVSMNEIAQGCGIGVATLYRHYRTKADLVLAVSARYWRIYLDEYRRSNTETDAPAAKRFEHFLDSFLDMYRKHRELLRFNQYFNLYIQNEHVTSDQMKVFMDVVETTAKRFHEIYLKGISDGTLRTDIPEEDMFSASLHLMLAAVTRYAVGLAYQNGSDLEKELCLLKDSLLKEYTQC